MAFNIAWPTIEFLLWWACKGCCIYKDKNFSEKKTKCKLKQEYIDLYSGPEYFIHYRYSFVLNIVFITFMFGAGLPILFILALVALVCFYCLERLLLAWYYKKPPMFDDKLNSLAIKILMIAPILYCAFGFWMYNNPQIFTKEEVLFA